LKSLAPGILLIPWKGKAMDAREELKVAVDDFARSVQADDLDDDDDGDDIGELEVSEYIIMMLSFDTFVRYVEETTGIEDPSPSDSAIPKKYQAVMGKGMKVLRIAERELPAIRDFLDESLPSQGHKRMLAKAMRIRVTSTGGANMRAFQLRTVLSRGGAKTMRAVFTTNRMLLQIREAIAAAMMEDGDAALDLFAAFIIKNARIRGWIDLAAKVAGGPPEEVVPAPDGEDPLLTLLNETKPVLPSRDAVDQAAKEASDRAPKLLAQNVEVLAASGAEETQRAEESRRETLRQVEEEATEAARKAVASQGGDDAPLTRSETVGVAVAAATAAISDPSKPENVPASLQTVANDPEQLAAALTDGKVLVTAGAGAGKTRTLVARIKYLLNERGTLPTRILVTSFNKKAAKDLKGKIADLTGAETANMMTVGTMNSLFLRGIMRHGDPVEKTMMGRQGFKGDGSAIARQVQRLWPMCYPDTAPPKMRDAMLSVTSWHGNDVDVEQAMSMAQTEKQRNMALWYEMYEGFKGALGDWKPTCEDNLQQEKDAELVADEDNWRNRGSNPRYRPNPDKAKYQTVFQSFLGRHRPGGIRLGDFDDQINIFRDILKRNPSVRSEYQQTFDHVLVDE